MISANTLQAWTGIPGGEFNVSLWERLSHSYCTVGTTVHGFPGYRRKIKTILPASAEFVLQGKGNTPTVCMDGKKGEFSYSGGVYMIAQIFAEDVSQLLPFDKCLQNLMCFSGLPDKP
jgi:hypothetical protein